MIDTYLLEVHIFTFYTPLIMMYVFIFVINFNIMKYKYLTVFRLGLVFDETGFLLIRYSDFCHSLKVIELRFFHNETILFYKSEI